MASACSGVCVVKEGSVLRRILHELVGYKFVRKWLIEMGDVYFLRRLTVYRPKPANGESAKAIVAASGTTSVPLL